MTGIKPPWCRSGCAGSAPGAPSVALDAHGARWRSAVAAPGRNERPEGPRIRIPGLGMLAPMEVPVELVRIAEGIVGRSRTDEEWAEYESDDEFQTEHLLGGYDATESAFYFSVYAADRSRPTGCPPCRLSAPNRPRREGGDRCENRASSGPQLGRGGRGSRNLTSSRTHERFSPPATTPNATAR